MGEIPLEVKVMLDDVVQKEVFYAYHCQDCIKLFLLEEIIEKATCPYCGNKNTVLLEEYT